MGRWLSRQDLAPLVTWPSSSELECLLEKALNSLALQQDSKGQADCVGIPTQPMPPRDCSLWLPVELPPKHSRSTADIFVSTYSNTPRSSQSSWKTHIMMDFKVFSTKINFFKKKNYLSFERQREWEWEKERFHPLIHFPNAHHNDWGWARLKLWDRNTVQAFYMSSRNPLPWAITTAS